MRGAWFLAVVVFFATTETGCKVKERTAVSTASNVETASEAHRDSVRVVTRDHITYRIDTLTVREVVREYGAPLLVRDPDSSRPSGFITPLIRKTTRETEQGARQTWQERADSLMQARADVAFREDSTAKADTRTDRTTDDKSGWYLTVIALGALAVILFFLDKRTDKYL